MLGNLLIAPANGVLGRLLVEKCVGEGYSVTAGVRGDPATQKPAILSESRPESGTNGNAGHASADPSLVRWEPRSFISARNLVLSAANRFDRLDRIILIHEPSGMTDTNEKSEDTLHESDSETRSQSTFTAMHEISPAAIERFIDANVTGMLLLMREAVGTLVRQKGGGLFVANWDPQDQPDSALAACSRGAISAWTETVVREYQDETIDVAHFDSQRDDADSFASYILSHLSTATDGKRYRHCSRSVARIRLGNR